MTILCFLSGMSFWGGLGMTAEAGPSLGLLLSSGICCALSLLGSSSEGHFPESLGPEISSWAHWPTCSHGRKDLVPVIMRLAWSLFQREAVGGWSYLCIWIPGQTSPEGWEPPVFLGTLRTPEQTACSLQLPQGPARRTPCFRRKSKLERQYCIIS